MADAEQGASLNEQLLYAAKTDDDDLLNTIFATNGSAQGYDINYQDGLGMTALHYAAQAPSPTVLELILEHEGTDVDLPNRLKGDTPLHLACQLQHPDARQAIAMSLLEAGADPRIRNRSKTLPVDMLGRTPQDEEIKKAIRQAEAEASVDMSHVVQDDDDDGDERGGDSGEE